MSEVLNISVISAAYNAGAYLEDFIKSVFEGQCQPQELIITDDGSTDNSASILQKLEAKYKSLTCIISPKNQGVAVSRNKAIELAKSKYIAIADSDDILFPARLKKQFDFLEANPDIDVLGSNCAYFSNAKTEILNHSNFPLNHKGIVQYLKNARNGVLNGTVMLKSELLKSTGFRQEKVWAEDYDLFVRLLKQGAQFAALKESLMYVRIHERSATSNLERETISKIHSIREEVLGIPVNEREIEKEFKHILSYRKAMLSQNPIQKVWHLMNAVWHRPEKLLKRFGL